MVVNANVEQHALIRPFLEHVCGPDGQWKEVDIVEHASNFLDKFIDSSDPLRISNDIQIWAIIYLHKVCFRFLYTRNIYNAM